MESAPSTPMGRAHLPFILLFSLVGLFLLLSLPSYGLTIDVIFEYPRAAAYVDHLVSGRDAPQEDPEGTSRPPWDTMSYAEASGPSQASCNPCLPSLVAALSGKLFFEFAGLLGVIDAYHLGLTLLWLACLFYIYVCLAQIHSARIALVAVAFTTLAPRVLAHVHNNPKDLPAMAFVAMAMLDFHIALARRRPWRLLMVGFLLGCALSAKFTAAIALAPMALLFATRFRKRGFLPYVPRAFIAPLLAAPLLALGVIVAHWPYLWVAPLEIVERLRTVLASGMVRYVPDAHPTLYPLWMFAVTTPPIILAGTLLGIVVPARRSAERSDAAGGARRTYLVWLGSMLLIWSSGRIFHYDGIRNMLQVWPAFAFLAAMGYARTASWIHAWWHLPRRVLRRSGGALFGAALAIPILFVHPHELAYFNFLAGGIEGAARRARIGRPVAFESGDYWGSSLRGLVRWANEHLPRGAHISFATVPSLLHYYRFRGDLTTDPAFPPDPSRPHYLIFLNRTGMFDQCEPFALAHGEMVHREEIAGQLLSGLVLLPPGWSPCQPRPMLRVEDGAARAGASSAARLELRAGPCAAGCSYIILAGASGARPGMIIARRTLLPLNPDGLTLALLYQPDSPGLHAFHGALDTSGTARIRLGPLMTRSFPAPQGIDLHLVAVLFSPKGLLCSDAVRVHLAH